MKIRGYCLVTITDETGDERVLPAATIDPRREFRHSPDGFQWSYGGSGPAELARAILVAAIPGDDRVRHPRCYQQFKGDRIAPIKADEFELDVKDVREWYAAWLIENPTAVEAGWLDEPTEA